MKSKDQANLGMFYVKESSKLIKRETFEPKTHEPDCLTARNT